MIPNNNQRLSASERVFINNSIRVPKVLVIDDAGKNLGVLPTYEALKIAVERGLDLVQMSPPRGGMPPTCKILDYGKYKYTQSKNTRAAERKQRESEVKTKEICFRPVTDDNDLRIKAKKTQEFLHEGDKVKIVIKFRNREASHKEVAMNTFNYFLDLVGDFILLSAPSMEGSKALVAMLGKKS